MINVNIIEIKIFCLWFCLYYLKEFILLEKFFVYLLELYPKKYDKKLSNIIKLKFCIKKYIHYVPYNNFLYQCTDFFLIIIIYIKILGIYITIVSP